jgi:hypothetical protein
MAGETKRRNERKKIVNLSLILPQGRFKGLSQHLEGNAAVAGSFSI